MICTIGIGFSFYLLHNTLQAKATEIAPHATGTALALFSMSWASGQAVGAALMGVGVAFAGYAPMIVLFALGFALVGVTLRLNLQRL